MPEWIKDFLLAVGGGSVVLVGILTVFKSIFIKLVDTGLETSFGKSLEKYKNKLIRTTKAYEILLEREMRFYEKIEPVFANLIIIAQDLLYYSNKAKEEKENYSEHFTQSFTHYMEEVITLKNESLIHQTYIPEIIFLATTDLVKVIQGQLPYWKDMCKLMQEGKYDMIDDDKGEEYLDSVLKQMAKTEIEIRKRLKELSGEN